MKAELQFFALPNDRDDVLTLIKDKVDAIETQEANSHLIIGDCELVYTPGSLEGSMLIVGSLTINTGPVDDSCADQERAKKVYRHIRSWFKKNYSNKLYTYMLEGDKNETAARNHWISPAATAWVQEDNDRQLKLYDTSPLVFDLMVVKNTIGKLIPVESNKVRGHG